MFGKRSNKGLLWGLTGVIPSGYAVGDGDIISLPDQLAKRSGVGGSWVHLRVEDAHVMDSFMIRSKQDFSTM
jgi:hypothetical protein